MKIRSKFGLVLTLLLIAVVIISGCSSGAKNQGSSGTNQTSSSANQSGGNTNSSEDIVVGTSLALSGSLASAGKAELEGINTYFNLINEQGGIDGKKIKVVSYDDEYQPAKTLANAKLLVEKDHVLALVAPFGTATVLAMNSYLESQNVPMIGAASNAESVTNPPKKVIFAIPSPMTAEAQVFVDYAVKNLNKNKIAILYQNDAWGQPAFNAASKRMQLNNLKFTEVQTFERLTTDLTSQVMKLKASNPDVVIMYALGEQAGLFLKKANELGWHPTIFGPSGLNDPSTLKLFGPAGKGLYMSMSYYPLDSDKPGMQEFMKAYKKYYPSSTPNIYAQCGYAGAEMFVEAYRNAGQNPTGEKLIEAMEKLKNFDQKIGPPINFSPISTGEWARRGQTAIMLGQYNGEKVNAVTDWIDIVSR